MVLMTFRSDCEQRGPLNEHPVVDVRARRALLRTLTLLGTWRSNPRHTAPLDRSYESSQYLKQITGDDLLCSPYVIGQTIIFLPCDFFLAFFFLSFFPRLISAAVDWMSTILPHMVWP